MFTTIKYHQSMQLCYSCSSESIAVIRSHNPSSFSVMSNNPSGVLPDGSRSKAPFRTRRAGCLLTCWQKPPRHRRHRHLLFPIKIRRLPDHVHQLHVQLVRCLLALTFANIQDFDRYGMQILQQAHLASMCMETSPTSPPVNLQMMQSQFSPAASIVPVSNVSLQNVPNSMTATIDNNMPPVIQPTTSSALQLATNVRPYVPRPVNNPMLSEWPPAKDKSLPKEGWFLLSDLWVHFPSNYQHDISEISQSVNCSLMQGCFEVPWQQNPMIFVLLEFQHLLIYDSAGPLQILDSTEIKDPATSKPTKSDFNRLNAIMLRFRMVATRSASRMRSISELEVREYVQGKETDQNVIQLTAAYLTGVVENPDFLAVDTSYWQKLACDSRLPSACSSHPPREDL